MKELEALFRILRSVLPYNDGDLTVPPAEDVRDHPDSMWVRVPDGGLPTRYVRIGTMTTTFDDEGRVVGCGRWMYGPPVLTAVGRVNDAVRRGVAPHPDDLAEILPPGLSPEAREHILRSVGAPRATPGTKVYAEKVFAVAKLVNARDRGLSANDACDHVRQLFDLSQENESLYRWRREVDSKFGVAVGEWTMGDMPYPIGC